MQNKNITIYAFYNNKGGVGKTTLCANAASLYAEKNNDTLVLVIDMCPQANVSQFLLGGGQEGYENMQKLQSAYKRRNIVGFMDWLLKGNSNKTLNNTYKVPAFFYNRNISENLYLIAGDSFLESFSLALNYAVINPANMDAWKEYMTAIGRLCTHEFSIDKSKSKYKKMVVFIDCNPSFSIYTQMALVSADRLVIPVMADFSSLEGIKGIFMLLYGLYPSAALQRYANPILTFSKQAERFNLSLPLIDQFIFNSFTKYDGKSQKSDGIATAYGSVRKEIIDFCYEQFREQPCRFSSDNNISTNQDKWTNEFFSDVKDFHSAGKVSSALGIPMFKLPAQSAYTMPDGKQVQLPSSGYQKALDNISDFVNKLCFK